VRGSKGWVVWVEDKLWMEGIKEGGGRQKDGKESKNLMEKREKEIKKKLAKEKKYGAERPVLEF
jgi:hypothetical protein